MQRPLTRTRMAGAIAALAVASVLGSTLVAYADNIQDNIADDVTSALVLEAGGTAGKTAKIKVIGNNSQQDPDDGCNIDGGESPLVLDVLTPIGVTANPDPLSVLACGTDYTVTFTAGANAQSGTATVSIVSGPAGGGTYQNQVSIPITVTHPNTRPTVTVQGVAAGSYEIGSVPVASCAVADAEDGPSTVAAVITETLSHGLGTQTATCNHTDSGNLAALTASVSYTIVDTGDPAITHTITGTGPNDNGWYRSPVGIAFACTDVNGSGIKYCGENALFGDGADQTVTGTAEDWAGNTAQDVVSNIDVDATAPVIQGVLSPAAPNGAAGWYLGPVDVDFQCSDALSGIDTCTGDTTIGDGAAGSANGSALDKAGNTAQASVSDVKVDTGDPTIGYTLTSAAAKVNGWYSKPVTVHFVCADAVSGVASCSADAVLGDGRDQSVTGTVTDAAGRSATRTVEDIDVDTTAPTVAFAPGFGSSFVYGNVPAAPPTCEASDALSGLASCVVTGGGTTLGGHSFVATATDAAGNVNTATLNYTVLPWNLTGFFNPVDMGVDVWNTVKNGSTVPLKFEVFAGAAELTNTSAITSFSAVSTACPTAKAVVDEIEFVTTGGTMLRYDSSAGQFVQNWATPKKAGACVKVTMTTQDRSTLVANFILK